MHVKHLMPQRFRPLEADVPAAGQAGASGLPAVAAMSLGLHRGGKEFAVEVSYASGKASGVAWHTLVISDITSRMRDYEALSAAIWTYSSLPMPRHTTLRRRCARLAVSCRSLNETTAPSWTKRR